MTRVGAAGLLALLALQSAPPAAAALSVAEPWAFFADPVWTIDGDRPGPYCYSSPDQLRIGFGGSLGAYRRVHLHLPGPDDRLFEARMSWNGSLHEENGQSYWRGGRFHQEWRNESTTASVNPLPKLVSGEFPTPQVMEVRVEDLTGVSAARGTDTYTLHRIPAGLSREALLEKFAELGCTRQAELLRKQRN